MSIVCVPLSYIFQAEKAVGFNPVVQIYVIVSRSSDCRYRYAGMITVTVIKEMKIIATIEIIIILFILFGSFVIYYIKKEVGATKARTYEIIL